MSAEKATAASYMASGSMVVYGAFTVQEWVAIVGGIATVLTLLVNGYYRRKEARRQEAMDIEKQQMARELHTAKLRALER